MKTEQAAMEVDRDLAPFVNLILDEVDERFPGAGNVVLRHAIHVLLIRTTMERMDRQLRLDMLTVLQQRFGG